MKTMTYLIIETMLSLSLIAPVTAGSYADNHNDGTLSGWTAIGGRKWSESGGYAVPSTSDQNYKGFLINNHACVSDGLFTFKIKGSGDLNSLEGGAVFRYVDSTHFYFVAVAEANASGQSSDNAVRLKKNSTDARSGYVAIKSGLDFSGLGYNYTIKVRVSGSTFTFWLNGDSLGQYTDAGNTTGSVGYAYDDLTNGYISMDSSSWVDAFSDYTWDIATTAGIQPGSGTWGTNSYWTINGTTLIAWPGAGNTATFGGADGSYAMTVSGVQAADSLTFLNTGYTLSGGTVNLGSGGSVFVIAGKSAVIGSAVSGTAALSKYGVGTLTLTGTSAMSGGAAIRSGTLQLGSGGTTGMVTGPIVNGGTLTYNRSNGDSISAIISGTGALVKAGTGVLTIIADNSYSGATTISSGTLLVRGSTAAASAVNVAAGATLGGTGYCKGPVTVDGTIAPGISGPGKLSTGALTLGSTSVLNFDLGTKSDTVAVIGALTLDGTVNFTAAAGFAPGTYRLFTCSGTLTDNTLTLGSRPVGEDFSFIVGTGNLDVKITPHLIQTEPKDTVGIVGRSVSFAVSAAGEGTLAYKWQRYPGDSVSAAASLSVASVTPADSSARFRCIVRDSYAADTSVWARLTVIDAPHIVVQPKNIYAPLRGTAVFSLTATDTTQAAIGAPLTYTWIRNGSDTVRGMTTNSLTLLSAQKSDDNSRFRCVISNKAGSVASQPCTLRVVSAGFGADPRSGFDSLTVRFADSSTGAVSAFRWNFGDGSAPATEASPSHFYAATGVFSVTQTVSAGGITDSARLTDFITVKHAKPSVSFTADTFYAVDSLTVHFRDQSKGLTTGKRWDFGDGASDTSPVMIITHHYADTGTFTVKLTVTGPGGTDSMVRIDYIKIRSKGEYPVILKTRRLSADSVEVSFYNFLSIVTSKKTPLPPWADSMGLWFKRGAIPTSASDSLIAGYNIIALQETGLDRFVDTVRVPYSPPADSAFYGFNSAAYWVNGGQNAMKSGNGDLVLMRDTARPPNSLVVSGAYLDLDVFQISVGPVSSLDARTIDSVGIGYGFSKATTLTDTAHVKWFPLSSVLAGASQNGFTQTFRESRLVDDTARIHAAAVVAGKNRLRSFVKDTSFIAGRHHPDNPVGLFAKALSPTSIQVSWKDKTSGNPISGVDSIAVWRGVKALPLIYAPSPEFFTAVRPAVKDTALLCRGLNEKTRYYFGAQIFSHGLWSAITDVASATDSTPPIVKVEKPVNTITMTNLWFDASTNRIVTCWHVDSFDTAMEIGIAYSLKSYPADSLSPPSQIVRAASATDSSVVDVKRLELDSTYYVTLWLRKNEGKWALPTAASQRSLKLPADVSWQVVNYFVKYPDTISVFRGNLLLATKDGAGAVPTTDTIKYCEVSSAQSNGFVAVSRGFRFALHPACAPFSIGIRYAADSIPFPYSPKDVRIYVEKQGALFALPTSSNDTARHMIWAVVHDANFPFIALVDTVAPSITVLSRTNDPVPSGADISDTFRIRDNVANAAYNYRYAKGDGADPSAVSGELTSGDTIVTGMLARSYVSQGSGARAALVVSDGPHTVAVDVSRQVIRDGTSDVVSTTANKWCPLKTASLLDTPSVKRALKDLYVKGNWYYDNTEFRLFRWYSYSGNASDSLKWVEYADTTDWLFNLDPCRLIWIKTRKNTVLHLGKGLTTSLKKCYSIATAPHTWTDIALPYGFSVCVGDIIDSTNAANGGGGKGDSLQFYSWKADGGPHYRCRPLFMADFAMPGASLDNKGDSLRNDAQGFAVYNPFAEPVTVSFPPIPPVLSRYGAAQGKAKKSSRKNGWAIRIAAGTGTGAALAEVYCGYREGTPGMDYYPLPPSFSAVSIRVCDSLKRPHGHGLARGNWDRENGAVFPLAFSNRSDRAETVAFSIENPEVLPKEVKAAVIDCMSGKFEDATELSAVDVARGATSYRHLAVGTEAYLKKVKRTMQGWRLSLVSAFTVPYTHALKIRFTLPFAGVSGIRLTMVDLKGRTVWENSLPCGNARGLQEYIWDGGRLPVSPGIYILSMTATDERHAVAGIFHRKVSYLP